MKNEFMENNYMQALLRAALLLGDMHTVVPVHEISISGFVDWNHVRTLYPRCRIVVQPAPGPYPAAVVSPASPGEDYLILFPVRKQTNS